MKKLPLLITALASLGILGLLIALTIFWSGGFESAEQVRRRYAVRIPQVLKIAEPVQVTDSAFWLDGGTYGIELTDAQGQKHRFSLCHTYVDGAGETLPPPNLFVGALQFSKPGVQKVEVRGPEEADLYGIMLRWIERQPAQGLFFERPRLMNPQEQATPHLGVASSFFRRFEKHFAR